MSGDASVGFRELVFSDFRRYRRRPASWTAVLMTAPFVPGLLASLVLRSQQRLVQRGHLRLAWLARTVGISLVGADFVPGAQVGRGIMLSHPVGVVIGPGTVIGDDATLAGAVTFGVRSFHENEGDAPRIDAYPRLGDGVAVGAHAVLLGGIAVGDRAAVGANSVVTRDVAPGVVVAGSPARPVATTSGQPAGT